MAQTIKEIQTEILAAKNAAAELDALEFLTDAEQPQASSTSRAAVWRVWVYVYAFICWLQQKLQDAYFEKVNKRIADTQIHNREWYRQKALAFQFGFDLLPDSDLYDNSEATDEAIAESKIIKQAAIIKRGSGVLRCKVATITGGEFAPVDPEAITALKSYFELVEDAGTTVVPTTGAADDLKLSINIHYDPLILNNNGERLDDTNDTPAIDGVKAYLQSLDFNGELVINKLERYLESIEGIEIADVEAAASKYAAYSYDSELPEVPNVGAINQLRTAEAGYMKLDEGTSIFNYIVFNG